MPHQKININFFVLLSSESKHFDTKIGLLNVRYSNFTGFHFVCTQKRERSRNIVNGGEKQNSSWRISKYEKKHFYASH